MIYSIDFETRSEIDLIDRGLDVYANDASTEVLCIAFGTMPESIKVSTPQNPETNHLWPLMQHVSKGGKIQAWNALFEYAIWNCVCVPKYDWPPLKLEQCIDILATATANNIPQGLDDAGAFFNLEYKKDPIGKRLIQKLCKPHKGEFNNDPELLNQLYEYCRQDVKTEMSIGRILRALDASEQKVWELTQRINIRGVPVDSEELKNAVFACETAQNEIDRQTIDRKSTRLNSSHIPLSRMPSSA